MYLCRLRCPSHLPRERRYLNYSSLLLSVPSLLFISYYRATKTSSVETMQ